MIDVHNVSKKFGTKQVLFNISFAVTKGEIVGFLGPNAAGKTTTMRIITCYLPATEGTVTVAGYDVFDQSLDVRRNIGYMPENPPLYYDMSVYSYLDFVARIKGIQGKNIKKRIDAVMERVSITNVRDRICGRLSKGYRQRVGLAQALIHNPPVLILDEPTSGLDPKQIVEVRQMIKSLSADHTIVISTHILPEVKLTCERVLIINEGRIVAEGTLEHLTQKIKGKEKFQVEVAGPKEDIIRVLKSIPGVEGATIEKTEMNNKHQIMLESDVKSDVRKDIARTIVENKWDLFELRNVSMTIEEIFMKYTAGEKVYGEEK